VKEGVAVLSIAMFALALIQSSHSLPQSASYSRARNQLVKQHVNEKIEPTHGSDEADVNESRISGIIGVSGSAGFRLK
jgi:hypothetical protein